MLVTFSIIILSLRELKHKVVINRDRFIFGFLIIRVEKFFIVCFFGYFQGFIGFILHCFSRNLMHVI